MRFRGSVLALMHRRSTADSRLIEVSEDGVLVLRCASDMDRSIPMSKTPYRVRTDIDVMLACAACSTAQRRTIVSRDRLSTEINPTTDHKTSRLNVCSSMFGC